MVPACDCKTSYCSSLNKNKQIKTKYIIYFNYSFFKFFYGALMWL